MRYFKVDNQDISDVPFFEVREIISTELPERIIHTIKKASDFGNFLTHADYGSRLLAVKGEFGAPGRGLLDINRDLLVKYVNKTEARLEFEYRDVNITCTGTLESLSFSDPRGGYSAVIMNFRLSDPLYYGETTNTGSKSNQTTSGFATNVANNGNVWNYCKVTINIDSLTDSGADTITVQGDDTSMIISRDWSANDTLVIDPSDFSVRVEGVVVDYQGQFPKINPGGGSIIYSDTFSARQVDVTLACQDRYL